MVRRRSYRRRSSRRFRGGAGDGSMDDTSGTMTAEASTDLGTLDLDASGAVDMIKGHTHTVTGGGRRRRRSRRSVRRGGAYRSVVGTAITPLALWAAQNRLGRSMGRHQKRSSGRKRKRRRSTRRRR